MGGRIQEFSILYAQFFCEPKTILKIQFIFASTDMRLSEAFKKLIKLLQEYYIPNEQKFEAENVKPFLVWNHPIPYPKAILWVSFLRDKNMNMVVLKLECESESPGRPVQTDCWALHLDSDSVDLSSIHEFAFLLSSQVMLMLLV